MSFKNDLKAISATIVGICICLCSDSTFGQSYDTDLFQIEMVFIPAGEFMMGQKDGEADEKPVHRVILDDFYIAKYEITVRQYRSFCKATNRQMPTEPQWGWKNDHPIINTTWFDAMAFIAWVNEENGTNYRLPTEAEFEYVIRAGGKVGAFPWGDEMPKNENISDESYGKVNPGASIWSGYDDGNPYTSPVGALGTNPLGVCDINGNIWEWVSDWYSQYPTTDLTNPVGPENGVNKVGRGGSFNSDPWHSRTASRAFVKPQFSAPGFRLARDRSS